MQLRHTALAALCAVSLSAFAGEGQPHWSYTGKDDPTHWGELSPAFVTCKLGKNQSPVDLSSANAKGDNSVEATYPPLAYSVENNGHTIQATPTDAVKTLKLGGEAFTLKQFHFHTPSEHTFLSKYFPMEAHFVHQNERGELAVIGVMFEKGAENAALAPLLAKPLKAGEKTAIADKLDIAALFPKDQNHFRLNGSLTTPPCSEGVNWIVFKTPVEASEAQFKAMEAMIGQANNRPVQPLNARIVIEE
ncbi:carbonic anhydrase [Cardiobacterium valvarum]|uniref:carbonic anhydrase n=1 Tax=Cardiobacterium valvarum TaxID=194702 RepID=A0A381E9F0_9GAMM|nr:carbonic anhydrase family protein [Cardiobacterium valvarum]SUX23529.1 Carbonic anhydrase precursor [Cardiobacterium valvarum]